MAKNEHIRIEIGFDGGQVMAALVEPAAADQLERALGAASEKALVIDADDARYTVVLARVVYVKRFARESRVGFGA